MTQERTEKKRRDQTKATQESGKNAPRPNPIGLDGQPNLVKQPERAKRNPPQPNPSNPREQKYILKIGA